MAVTQQPRQLLGPAEGHREWKGVLLACCTDCKSCKFFLEALDISIKFEVFFSKFLNFADSKL